MLFIVEKCKVMHIGNNNINATYEVNGVNLEEVLEERDLRLIMQNYYKCCI